VVARTQRRRLSPEADARERLSTRIAELEQRLRRLEARVRVAPQKVSPSPDRPVKRARPQARCPGCLLELPRGRHGEACVWCGFVFEAAGGSRRAP
jgi:hypothetical protein